MIQRLHTVIDRNSDSPHRRQRPFAGGNTQYCSPGVPVAGLGIVALLSVSAGSCARQQPASQAAANPIERGSYLVTIGGCNDCHSPKVFTADGPVPDTSRLLSGHPSDALIPPIPRGVVSANGWGALASGDLTAWAGPWGVSFATNLTPDATGLAAWTPEVFVQAMRTGKHLGVGRPILPPMPWQDYGRMSDDDLRAVFAYFRSLKPMHNAVPEPVLPASGKPAAP